MFYRKENSQTFSIWRYLIFYDKKSWKSKIAVNFQFLTLKENWMDEWPTDPCKQYRCDINAADALDPKSKSTNPPFLYFIVLLGWRMCVLHPFLLIMATPWQYQLSLSQAAASEGRFSYVCLWCSSILLTRIAWCKWWLQNRDIRKSLCDLIRKPEALKPLVHMVKKFKLGILVTFTIFAFLQELHINMESSTHPVTHSPRCK